MRQNLWTLLRREGVAAAEIARWSQMAAGMPFERIRLLIRAGYSPEDATKPDVARASDEQLEMVAKLRDVGDAHR